MAITLDEQIAWLEMLIPRVERDDEICQAILQSLESLREEEDERD